MHTFKVLSTDKTIYVLLKSSVCKRYSFAWLCDMILSQLSLVIEKEQYDNLLDAFETSLMLRMS